MGPGQRPNDQRAERAQEQYVAATRSVKDVTGLAHKVGEAHLSRQCSAVRTWPRPMPMAELLPELPIESHTH